MTLDDAKKAVDKARKALDKAKSDYDKAIKAQDILIMESEKNVKSNTQNIQEYLERQKKVRAERAKSVEPPKPVVAKPAKMRDDKKA